MASLRQYQSIADLQQAFRDRKTTVKNVTSNYLAVIEKLNPSLNCVTVVNEKAVEDAEHLDSLAPEQRGPLYGVPLLIKDQFETKGIRTSFGSKACKDYIPTQDATVVRKLREAGAVILGKTTLPDWGAGLASTSSLSGTTKHPIDPSRDPGGSSSGNGTAVAANMSLAAIGGDTGGSVRHPASHCGLVGLRPTPGRISRHGMSAIVLTQDTPGPMCKNVEDAAKIMDVLVGFDEVDSFTSINAFTGRTASPTQFQDAIKQPFLEGKRLGVLNQLFGDHNGINQLLKSTMHGLEAADVELVDVEVPADLEDATSTYLLRGKSDINNFLSSREGLKHLNVEDLYATDTYHPMLPIFKGMAKGSTDYLQSPHFANCLVSIDEFRRVMGSLFAKHNLDAIVYPTDRLLAAKTKDILEGRWDHFPNTLMCANIQFTAVTVPIGRVKDDNYPNDPELPVGLEILGVPLSEERILNIAAGIEALQHKK